MEIMFGIAQRHHRHGTYQGETTKINSRVYYIFNVKGSLNENVVQEDKYYQIILLSNCFVCE